MPLLERAAEHAALRSQLLAAAGGRGRCVVISGPAGIGKSRLLAEARELGDDLGLAVVTARGTELEREFAFGAVLQLFERALAESGPRARADLLQGTAAHAAPVFAASGGAVGSPVDPGGHAILHGLYWFAAGLARRGPLLLVVDDAQWLDAPSLRWLAYLVNRLDELPIAVVIAARSGEESGGDLLRQIVVHPAAEAMTLRPLSAGAVGELAAAALEAEAEPGFVEACLEATGGNPFYLDQLLGDLARAGIEPTASAAQRVYETAPATVVDAVAHRLARLASEHRRLAEAVAVLGEGDPVDATRLAGLSPDAFRGAAAALAEQQLLTADARGLVHPLVRTAILLATPSAERDELHTGAARLLLENGASAERVAAQVLAAPPGTQPWAVEVLLQAASTARLRGGAEVACGLLERALTEVGDGSRRIDVLRALAPVWIPTRGLDGLAHLQEALELADSPSLNAEISLELATALYQLGFFGESAEVLQATEADPQLAGLPLLRRVRGQLATMALVDLPTLERLGGLEGVTALLRQGEETDAVGRAALGWALIASTPPVSDGLELTRSALEDPGLLSGREPMALGAVAAGLWAADRYVELEAALSHAVGIARSAGSQVHLHTALVLRALVLSRMGRLDAAEADVRELLEWASVVAIPLAEYRVALPWILTPLVDVLIARGELAEAEHWVVTTQADAEWPHQHGANYLLDALGRLRLAQGRAGEAVALLRECGRRQESWGIANPGFMPWRSSLALALESVGERDEALGLAETEIEVARAFGVPRELGMALRARATLAEGDEALALLREAAATLEPTSAALEHAHALADLGAALRARGDETAAREPLRSALDLAVRCGATAVAERARRELVAAGAKPRRAQRTGAAALTAAEHRVAQLATKGLSNREIAAAIHVSEKTVEGHLGHAYRKLAISSRTGLAGALGERSG